MRRYALRDDQWDRIKDLLPGRAGCVGVTAKDNRLFVEAVLYQRVEETRLPSCGSGWTLTTSIAASVPVATTRMAAAAPSAVVRSSRRADARARNSRGVPAPTRRRMIRPRLYPATWTR